MLLGDTCTRGCRFCHVNTGKPGGVVDKLEPIRVGSAVAEMGLTYIVLTSVDRDDLADGGAGHFAETVEVIKHKSPETLVEILTSDFRGNPEALERISRCGADVFAHNLETVRSLTPKVRDPRCGYDQSLFVLREFKRLQPKAFTKSSLMVGLGETEEEMSQAMDDLRLAGVDILTVGQYLRPSPKHLPVIEYVHPTVFKKYEEMGLSKGFLFVPSGPLVRSSYRAGEKFLEAKIRSEREEN